jgi:hypothetical protein
MPNGLRRLLFEADLVVADQLQPKGQDTPTHFQLESDLHAE